jgi:hypothetical protein
MGKVGGRPKMVYGIYDMKMHEALVCIGVADEICSFLNKTAGSFRSTMSKGYLVKGRFRIEPIGEVEDEGI